MSTQQVIQVPKNKHSALIGRGGSVIRDIEQQSGANVKIPPRDDQAATGVTLQGTPEQIAAAITQITSILGFAPSTTPLATKQLRIDASRYGQLIGPRGATLRQLEQSSGASIDVPRRGDDSDLVSVSGSDTQLAAVIFFYYVVFIVFVYVSITFNIIIIKTIFCFILGESWY
jgi:polyribonucleotide nucleotidyltransferase